MSTVYTCRKCPYIRIVRPGQITTAQVPTHCDFVMESRPSVSLEQFVQEIIERDEPGLAFFTTIEEPDRYEVIWARAEYGSDREGLDLFTIVKGRVAQGVEVMYHDLDHDALARVAAFITPGKEAGEIEGVIGKFPS